jgi:hypothetical protein
MITAVLINHNRYCSSLQIRRDVDLCVSVKNPISNFEVREKITLNPSVHVEQEENAREPPHHFSLKWQGSKKASVIEVLDAAATRAALKKKKSKLGEPRHVTGDDSGKWVPILAFECRGLEPYVYHAGDEFVVTSEGGTTFDSEVDLSDGDWTEYDDEHNAPISISEVEFKFEAV